MNQQDGQAETMLIFSNQGSCLTLARLMRRHVNTSHVRYKSTTGQPTDVEPISSTITRLYNNQKEQQSKVSSIELSKVRASQRQEAFLMGKRRMYEKITLYSYLNVCIDVGQINRAFNTLMRLNGYRKNQLVDISHYNAVLKGWARLASVAQVLETRMHMMRSNIEPNAESFAYILMAYAKSNENRKSTIKRLFLDMRKRSIDPTTIFQHAYVSMSDRKAILTMMRQVDPNYDDAFLAEPIQYDCRLLENIDKTPSKPYDHCNSENMSKFENWAEHQFSVENKSSVVIKSIATLDESSPRLARYSKLWIKLNELWRKSLSSALDASLESLQQQSEDATKIHLYPYLCSVDKNMLIHLMLDEVESNSTASTYSFSTNTLHLNFGHKVMTRYLRSKSLDDGSHQEKQKIYKDYLREYCTNPKLMGQMNPRQFIQLKAVETKNYAIYKDKLTLVEEWPHHIVVGVGKFLYGLILREVKFDPDVVRNPKRDINMNNLVHAFYTAYFQIDCSHKIKEEFRAHQDFEKLQSKACAIRLKFDYSFLPCSSPPLPWLSRKFGGYLSNKTDLVRVNNPFAEQIYLTNQMGGEIQKLYPSLDSLNAIGLCPWIVNTEILDIVIKLFREGGDDDLSVPLDETKMVDRMPVMKENGSKADRILFNKEKKRYDQKRREMYSLWRDCLYRLSIANQFRDKTFWFPHNMDFRGRTYPVPPHFNHLGADLARALLLFAKGQPLGDKGLDWLKIHLINLVGNMKSKSLLDRLKYANSILHLEVLDSADNPWDGRRWWMNNECPWQVLACCKEIAKAIRSRDFRQYISHFPVHQDGSCNGLQHYAALGRDPGGAQAVNLVPSDVPQDVYSRVVEIVEAMRERDAQKGNKQALMLKGFIQRKVIKQTVMTTVYGVTRYGARQQIARQLAAKGYNEREVWLAAQYLASKTFESIGQMFNKSRIIQDWLNECAYIIASKCRQPVSWETPLGFPVTQPYTLPSTMGINRLLSSSVGGSTLINDPLSRLNAPKQKTAFPPNYIHSLDSSHMMLTSLHCQRQGITFVSVHDCYWTHPDKVDSMNRICREQFIALHSEPLLLDLSNQFLIKYGEYFDKQGVAKKRKLAAEVTDGNPMPSDTERRIAKPLIEVYEKSRELDMAKSKDRFLEVPAQGELDLNVIKNSTYFFS